MYPEVRPVTTTFSSAPVQLTFLGALIGAASFLIGSAACAQPRQPEVVDAAAPRSAQQGSAPVDPQTASCNDLKAEVKTTGELRILAGPRNGWGDTFYGPSVPRCQFYQMPRFAYVRARDGLCGVGYICVDKLSMD